MANWCGGIGRRRGRELQSKLPADPAGRGRSLAGCPHAQRFITLAHATRRGRRRTNRGRTCGRAGHVCLANAAGRRLECAIELEDAGLRRRGRGGAISLAVADSCGVSAFEGGHRHRGEGHATRPSGGYGAASRGGGEEAGAVKLPQGPPPKCCEVCGGLFSSPVCRCSGMAFSHPIERILTRQLSPRPAIDDAEPLSPSLHRSAKRSRRWKEGPPPAPPPPPPQRWASGDPALLA